MRENSELGVIIQRAARMPAVEHAIVCALLLQLDKRLRHMRFEHGLRNQAAGQQQQAREQNHGQEQHRIAERMFHLGLLSTFCYEARPASETGVSITSPFSPVETR
ncbi:hypothetical protein SDC9_136670 [bioreactor metagenome]|uniref:Uncharacterized protein n=1 Tax=bioreactor metagenome TaxID=1076179 RepID=A0A645DJD0_9ZZZZ